ncbi:MAG: hypothetical protein IPO71_00250 [Nitrosomonas sp.]|nr:hypothetical protein [Nitrosomonas sp.]
MTETFASIEMAKCVGETEDTTIVDIAVATNALQIKIGRKRKVGTAQNLILICSDHRFNYRMADSWWNIRLAIRLYIAATAKRTSL